MKKVTFILAILMATNLAIGQTDYDVLPYFSAGPYAHYLENMTLMRNGNVLAGIALLNTDNGVFQDVHGWCFLKVSSDDMQVVDTAMIEDSSLPWKALLEPDPDGEGYLFAAIKLDQILSKYYLSICHFDEELDFDVANEINVPLEDSVSLGYEYYYLDDSDIILYYPVIGPDSVFVLSRFGLDGSLKHRQLIADSLCPINQYFGKIKLFNKSPKEYVVNGRQLIPVPGSGASLAYYRYCVLDSLFSIENIIQYGELPEFNNVFFSGLDGDHFESLDDSTYIIMTGYNRGAHERGVQVTKRNKVTHENYKTVYFRHDPTNYSVDYIIGIRRSSDDYLYLAYFCDGITVIKMDMGLNVIWQRCCHSSTQNGYGYRPRVTTESMQALENGGLSIGGWYNNWDWSGVFVLTLSAEGTGTSETETFIRPYLFYPNPAQDQLHLQYSPDVKPVQIELYDLQGRLVLTQRKGLESVDLQGLIAGQYLMKVTLENVKVFTDKIMKE